jgi:hypothetical protein
VRGICAWFGDVCTFGRLLFGARIGGGGFRAGDLRMVRRCVHVREVRGLLFGARIGGAVTTAAPAINEMTLE